MEIWIAFLPIIMIFLTLFVFKMSVVKAGGISILTAAIIARSHSNFHLGWKHIGISTGRGALIAWIAAYVMFFGIFLFHLMNENGNIKNIGDFFSRITDNRNWQVMLIVIGLSPIIESASGFGVSLMVITPILIILGLSRFRAVIVSLISLLAIPWGALATGMIIGAGLVDMDPKIMGTWSAILSVPIFLFLFGMAMYYSEGIKSVKEMAGMIILLSSIFSVVLIATNYYISVELAGVLAGVCTSLSGFLFLAVKNKRSGYSVKWKVKEFYQSMIPYLVLTLLIFLTRLIPFLKDFLNNHFVLDLKLFSFNMPMLYSPGFWLAITCLYTIMRFKIKSVIVKDSLKKTIKQWIPFYLSTTAFIGMSEIMMASGMTLTLATSISHTLGYGFLILSPFIGFLGGFLTGSNAGSNAMFIGLQNEIATQVGVNGKLIASIQNISSSHANMASPSRILLASTVFLAGARENELLRKVALVALGSTAIAAILTVLFQLIYFQ